MSPAAALASAPAPSQRGRRKPVARCEDCYFAQQRLCALPEGPCPTFRPATPRGLVPPGQLTLLERQAAASAARGR